MSELTCLSLRERIWVWTSCNCLWIKAFYKLRKYTHQKTRTFIAKANDLNAGLECQSLKNNCQSLLNSLHWCRLILQKLLMFTLKVSMLSNTKHLTRPKTFLHSIKMKNRQFIRFARTSLLHQNFKSTDWAWKIFTFQNKHLLTLSQSLILLIKSI